MNPHDIPGWEGTIGPFPDQYGRPHVYARDVHSGSGNCVCGAQLEHRRHVQAAPGYPITPDTTAIERQVREQVAAEIERRGLELRNDRENPINREEWACYGDAATIARGDA